MFCINCGQKGNESNKFCINCGEPYEHTPDSITQPLEPNVASEPRSLFQRINTSNLIKVLIGIAIVGFIVYFNIDDQAVENNNQALNSFNAGNSDGAISQLESASQEALTDETKVDTLKNLAYVYATEGQKDKALVKFKEALPFTKIDSFDYFLVLGEVAYLEGKPLLAKQHFEKAFSMNSSDFQINNSLALFYMDVEELYPQYADVVEGLKYARVAHNANNSAVTLGNLGAALVLNEKYTEAITYLKQINLQQHSYINLWLGLAYAGEENKEQAKFYFQQYVNTGAEVPPEITEYLMTN